MAGGAGGFPPGARRGPVGISRHHALALVHHGGGTARDLKSFALDVRAAVRETFGVTLEVEPEVLGPGRPAAGALLHPRRPPPEGAIRP